MREPNEFEIASLYITGEWFDAYSYEDFKVIARSNKKFWIKDPDEKSEEENDGRDHD